MTIRLMLYPPSQPAVLRLLEDGAQVRLGRWPDNDIQIDHPSVSRRHAVIAMASDHTWWLSDLTSKNGSRINGTLNDEAMLRPNDWISLGDVYGVFEEVDAAQVDAMRDNRRAKQAQSSVWLQRLNTDDATSDLLACLIQGIVDLAECQRGFLMVGDHSSRLVAAACYGISIDSVEPGDFRGSFTAIEQAATAMRSVVINDASHQPWLAARGSVIAQSLRTIIALPISYEGRLLGVAYADSDQPGKVVSDIDMDLLSSFTEQAALILAAGSLEKKLERLSECVEVDRSGLLRSVPITDAWQKLHPSVGLRA